MNKEQNRWNAAYTKGTLRKPTNTDKMEPGGAETDWAWYGVGAIIAVMMMVCVASWMLESLL